MSINSTQPVSQVSLQNEEAMDARQTQKGSAAVIDSTPETTQVDLSSAQTQLMQPGSQDIDMDKVERLRQAIQSGQLQTDSGKIADQLIALSSDDLAAE